MGKSTYIYFIFGWVIRPDWKLQPFNSTVPVDRPVTRSEDIQAMEDALHRNMVRKGETSHSDSVVIASFQLLRKETTK